MPDDTDDLAVEMGEMLDRAEARLQRITALAREAQLELALYAAAQGHGRPCICSTCGLIRRLEAALK